MGNEDVYEMAAAAMIGATMEVLHFLSLHIEGRHYALSLYAGNGKCEQCFLDSNYGNIHVAGVPLLM